MMGIANLGGKAIFCGKVGSDKHGFLIEEKLTEKGVKPILIKSEKATGSCISLVTPDNERTMLTNLGTAITLSENEIIVDDVKNSKILYVTGYVLEDPLLRKMALKALKEAKKYNKIVAIDLSDPALVKRCIDDLKPLLTKYADILIGNEEEVFALTGKKELEALDEMSKMCDIAVVKIGKRGTLIKEKNEIYTIPGFRVKAIDTTGAGDNFVAGLLFGLTNGYTTKQAGLIANFVGSKAVQELGGTLKVSLRNEVKDLFKYQ